MSTPAIFCAIMLLVVGHCLVRSYFLLRYGWAGGDTYYHFVLAEQIRIAGIAQLINKRFVVPEAVDYPPLLPFLLSRMPPGYVRRFQYIAPLSDTLTLIVVIAAAYWWWNPGAALISGLVYSLTPYTFDMAYSLNPRPIGNLFMSLVLIALVSPAPGIWPIALAAVCGCLVLLTHRLTAQSFAACLAIFALFNVGYAIGVTALAVGLAVLVSRRLYLISMKGHISFLRAIGFAKCSAVNFYNNFIRIVSGNPYILLIVGMGIWGSVFDLQRQILAAWVMTLLLLAQLWPFGEGDRHFANASSSVALLIGGSGAGGYAWVLAALGMACGIMLIGAKLYAYPRLAARGAGTLVMPTLREGCAVVRAVYQHADRPLILVLPQSLSYQVMYFADARVVLASGGTGAGLAYNWDLSARLGQFGLNGLRDEEQPDVVMFLDSVRIELPHAQWQLLFQRGGLSIYWRVGMSIQAQGHVGARTCAVLSN
ncbi:MAG: hypothetical protein U0074_03700 [Kouleothrix sp.]